MSYSDLHNNNTLHKLGQQQSQTPYSSAFWSSEKNLGFNLMSRFSLHKKWFKQFFNPRKFWSERLFSSERFWVQTLFVQKNIFMPERNYLLRKSIKYEKILVWVKKIWGPK